MWLFTAIGSVHGQASFTFALERGKTYSVGRDKTCDIRYESRYVKPKQGSVIVEDWDPNKPNDVPVIRWKSEPNKKGEYPSLKTIIPRSMEIYGSLDKGDYETFEVQSAQGIFLGDNEGMGVELADDSWFMTRWQPLSICHDRISKDEPAELVDKLNRYCISHTSDFAEADPPDIVINQIYKSTLNCNFAVCYGVRILLPTYLQHLSGRLDSCWKKVADHQDSFSLPDPTDPLFQPGLDSGLPHVRQDVRCWLPDKRRRVMFRGWKILGLRLRVPPAERRFMVAMGADYTDIDVVSQPLTSSDDFLGRAPEWWKDLEGQPQSTHALVVHFARVKEEMRKQGIAFNMVVADPSIKRNATVCLGSVCWGSVKEGSVQAFLDVLAPATVAPPVEASASIRGASRLPGTVIETAPTALVASQVADTPAATQRGAAVEPAFIPSSFPEETNGVSVKAPPSAQPRQSSTEISQSAASGNRKPLRRRAARKVDLFADDLSVIPESEMMPMSVDTQPTQQPHSASQRSDLVRSQDSQSQEMQTDTLAPRSRLKRRAAGTQTQSQYNFGFDDSFDIDRKAEEAKAEIEEVYAQTKASIPPSKRQRSSVTTGRATSEARSTRSGMNVDDGDEVIEEVEDPMQTMLRRAREAKTQQASATAAKATQKSMPPAPTRAARQRSASEEVENVETTKTIKKLRKETESAKTRKGSTQAAPDQDPQFLTAITKARKAKNAMDELDKEFNDLRIPKLKEKDIVPASAMTYDHPDWNLVDEFEDEMRGNFIQIVKKDLYRKDLGRKEPVRIDDGRPNFKKFKKKNIVRREPLKMTLAAPNLADAEMGEPYWEADAGRRPGMSQMPGALPEDDDEMPLVPRSKQRRLGGSNSPPLEEGSMATQRHRGTLTQGTLYTQRPTRTARASSVASDVSSAPSTRSRAKATSSNAKPAARGKKTTKEPVVIEDSEDEVAEDLDRTPSAFTTSASTRHRGRVTGTRLGTSTLEADPTPGGRTGRTTQPDMIHGTSAVTQSITGRTRRKLLVDDDDDDVTPIVGIQKKRRLG